MYEKKMAQRVSQQISEKTLVVMDTALWITHFCRKIYDFPFAYLRSK